MNNVLAKLFNVTVYHSLLSMEFKGSKNDNSCNEKKQEILSTIKLYDQGYLLLEGVSAKSLKERSLDQHMNVRAAPKKDFAPHFLPFFKCNVDNQTNIYVQWDTYLSSQEKSILLQPVSDMNELTEKVLYGYNIIYIYGIEQMKRETDSDKINYLKKQLQLKEEAHKKLKKEKQELQNQLSVLNKRKRCTE